jgi:hypothetical protein
LESSWWDYFLSLPAPPGSRPRRGHGYSSERARSSTRTGATVHTRDTRVTLFVCLSCVVWFGEGEKRRDRRERQREREREREARAEGFCAGTKPVYKLLPFLGVRLVTILCLLGSCFFLRVFVWVPLLRTCSSFFRLRLWLFLASSGVVFGSFGNPFSHPFLPPTRVPASCSPPLQRRKAFRQGRNMHVAVRGCTWTETRAIMEDFSVLQVQEEQVSELFFFLSLSPGS